MKEIQMTKPEFHYEEFEDYLFNAIQLSRNLTVDDCSDSEDVRRQLRLAISKIDNFSREVVYYMEELEPNGKGVAHPNCEGDRHVLRMTDISLERQSNLVVQWQNRRGSV